MNSSEKLFAAGLATRLFFVSAILSFTVAADEAEYPTLTVPQGELIGRKESIGKRETFANTIYSYKGIPYALPPTGSRRWKPSEPAPSWQGKRLAIDFGPECIQPPTSESSIYYRPKPHMSEDCLFLNVWTPSEPNSIKIKKLPVMVWIHGGGLVGGSGSLLEYDGTALAQKGVVLVTFNYRLNVFGYFSHPALTAESDHGSSGNYGITDQIQALKWVKENIANFGGDPDNVTIFGESAGAWSVSYLMTSPLSAGLFHRAIAQSGAAMEPMLALKKSLYNLPSAEDFGLKVARAVGITRTDYEGIRQLRNLPATDFLKNVPAIAASGYQPKAVIDGWVMPDDVYKAFTEGRQHNVPVLVGFNRDENKSQAGLVKPLPKTTSAYVSEVTQNYGGLAEEYLRLYPETRLPDVVFDANRDGDFLWEMIAWARMMDKVTAKAYVYFFTHAPSNSYGEQFGAYHGAEIPYVFNNVDLVPSLKSKKEEQALGDLMSSYWVAFAKNGAPQADGLSVWPAFTKEAQHYMEFNTRAIPKEALLVEHWEFNDKINTIRRQSNMYWDYRDAGLHGSIYQKRF